VCDVVGVTVGSIKDQKVSGKLIKSSLVGRTIACIERKEWLRREWE
jgi:hypothetical protein